MSLCCKLQRRLMASLESRNYWESQLNKQRRRWRNLQDRIGSRYIIIWRSLSVFGLMSLGFTHVFGFYSTSVERIVECRNLKLKVVVCLKLVIYLLQTPWQSVVWYNWLTCINTLYTLEVVIARKCYNMMGNLFFSMYGSCYEHFASKGTTQFNA